MRDSGTDLSTERRRLPLSFLLSLALHALLLSLTFGGQGFGLPHFAFPWQARWAEAPELRVMLQQTPVALAEQASATGDVVAPATIADMALPPTSSVQTVTLDQTRMASSAPTQLQSRPEDASLPKVAAKTRPHANTKPDLTTDTISAQAPLPPESTDVALTTPRSEVAVLSIDKSDEPVFFVPPPPPTPSPLPPATSTGPSPEFKMADAQTASELEQKSTEPQMQEPGVAPTEPDLSEQMLQRQAEQLTLARRKAEQREATRQEAARAEVMRLDAERQEAARVAAAMLEAERQDAARQEAARIEAERHELARLAAAKLAAQRDEAIRLEAARAEATRQKAARAEAARLEAERQDAIRIAAERVEAQRQEASRREAARIEAERQEVDRLTAAKLAAQREEAARLEALRAEAARLDAEQKEAARMAAAKLEGQRQDAARQEAARIEAERQELARLAAAQMAAQREEAARLDAARAEAARLDAERQEAARIAAAKLEAQRQESARQEAARVLAEKEEDARRDARRRAMGRQLDEEAARREAAATATRATSQLPLSLSTARRVRLWGRADANADLVQYAEAWARKIQLNTSADTIRELAKRPHTKPMVTVAIRSDGSVESITFVVSSGVPEIDETIRGIVQGLVPYEAFPRALAREYDVVEIRRTWHFDMAVQLY